MSLDDPEAVKAAITTFVEQNSAYKPTPTLPGNSGPAPLGGSGQKPNTLEGAIGAAHRSKRVTILIDNHDVTVVHLDTGEVIATNQINPDRNYWRNTLVADEGFEPCRHPRDGVAVAQISVFTTVFSFLDGLKVCRFRKSVAGMLPRLRASRLVTITRPLSLFGTQVFS